MMDTRIILIGSLLTTTLIYSVFMSLMTFTSTNLNFFPTVYNSAIKNKKSSKYYSTLLSNTVFSYVLFLLLLILLAEGILDLSKKLNGYSTLYLNSIIFFTVFLLILLIFNALLVLYAEEEQFFTSKNNIEYNYPFLATLVYTVAFIILGAYYIFIINRLYQSKKQKKLTV